MSQHTQVMPEHDQKRRFISYKNGRRVLFGFVPLPVAIGLTALSAGVALAAILLTTTITGQTTIKQISTSNDVDVTATSENGSALKCNVVLSNDDTSLQINPELTKQVGGGNASGVPIPGGTCTLTFTVRNTGDTTIKVDSTSDLILPAGWSKGPIEGLQTPIAKGETGTITAVITANEDATEGPVTGKLVYTDAV